MERNPGFGAQLRPFLLVARHIRRKPGGPAARLEARVLSGLGDPYPFFEPPGYRLDEQSRGLHGVPRHSLHHAGAGDDGSKSRLLLRHGKYAQPHGVYREAPRAPRRHPPVHAGGTDGMGSDFQPALRVLAQRRAARPRDLLRTKMAEKELPRLRHPGLLQPRCARAVHPDAADPEQGRRPLHDHQPLP